MKIEILDELCGTGKTHAIIQWMHNNPTKRYLYISPLLSEIEERITPECDSLGFIYPESTLGRSKGEHLLELLNEGHNVAFTHSLYSRLTKKHINVIKNMGYTLIIDEEVGMIEPLVGGSGVDGGYTNADLKYLYNADKIKVDSNDCGRLVWDWDTYGEDAQYSKLRAMCDLGMLYCADSKIDKTSGEKVNEIHSLVIQLPLTLLEACERVIIISYLFNGSIMESFLKLKNVEITPFDLDKENVSLRYSTKDIKEQIKPLINMIETTSTKKIGRKRLTYTWYQNEFTKEVADELNAAIRSVGDYCSTKKNEMMWTLPKIRAFPTRKNSLVVKPKGYMADGCFVHCSARATNEYSHKTTLVHCLYRHPNVTVETYLNHYGIEVDKDSFALSELIQWIWRSRIRNKESINLCILSSKMRHLFTEWLASKT